MRTSTTLQETSGPSGNSWPTATHDVETSSNSSCEPTEAFWFTPGNAQRNAVGLDVQQSEQQVATQDHRFTLVPGYHQHLHSLMPTAPSIAPTFGAFRRPTSRRILLLHALQQPQIVLVAIRLDVQINRNPAELLIAGLLDELLHESVVVAPRYAGRPHRRLLSAQGDLMGMLIAQPQLIQQRFLDGLVQDQEAVGADAPAARDR